MTIVDPASYYGLPAAPSAPPQPTAGVASPNQTSSAGPIRKGVFQDPVLLLVGLIFVAFLLARAAEHGLSFGFKVRAS